MKTLDNVKPSLIDSNAEMPTRAKRKHAERLSEKAPQGDAIVRSHGNNNHESTAEMAVPFLCTVVLKLSNKSQGRSYEYSREQPI